MKLPNGYGGIRKLGGHRRKPYAVVLTIGCDGQGRQRQHYLSYHKTRQEALAALAEYNANPCDLDAARLTFAELRDRWLAKAAGSVPHYAASAYANLAPLHAMTLRDIKRRHVQAAIDAIPLGTSSKGFAKLLCSKLFAYAVDLELIKDNLAHGVKIAQGRRSAMHRPFSADEIAMLWRHADDFGARVALVLIHTGMRPVELCLTESRNVHLEERYLVGGVKTAAGRDRAIPIAEKVAPFIGEWLAGGGEYLLMAERGGPMSYDALANRWRRSPALKSLPRRHLPHDGRHTCATLLDDAGVARRTVQLILGHAGRGITESVYTHKTIAQLVEAVNLI